MYIAHLADLQIFVTGGIGGVHRGAEKTFDISADLTELGKTPVTVVSAGIKSILDVPKTIEVLETLGVPTMSYQSDEVPDFFFASSGVKTPIRIDSPYEAANIIRCTRDLQLRTGLLVMCPIPEEDNEHGPKIKESIQQALKEADEQGIGGSAITPFLLKRVNEISEGASSASNVTLIKNNAKIGAQIACGLYMGNEF